MQNSAPLMIPYGMKVMAAEDQDGPIRARTLNWITLASFKPPMIELEVKAYSQIHDITKTARYFALNVLGKDQQGAAYTILKPNEHEGQIIRGEVLHSDITVTFEMDNTPVFVECRLLTTVEEGEHSIFIGEVGYADDVTVFLKDLGENKLRPV